MGEQIWRSHLAALRQLHRSDQRPVTGHSTGHCEDLTQHPGRPSTSAAFQSIQDGCQVVTDSPPRSQNHHFNVSGKNMELSQCRQFQPSERASAKRPSNRTACRLLFTSARSNYRRAKSAGPLLHRSLNPSIVDDASAISNCDNTSFTTSAIPECLDTSSDFFNPNIPAEERFDKYLAELQRLELSSPTGLSRPCTETGESPPLLFRHFMER